MGRGREGGDGKSGIKICFKGKNKIFSSFQRWPSEAKQHDTYLIRQGQKLKTVHTLSITPRDTNTPYRQDCHKLNFLSPGIFLSCHRHNYHTPSPKQHFHLTITIISRALFLNFFPCVTASFFLTSNINFTHD